MRIASINAAVAIFLLACFTLGASPAYAACAAPAGIAGDLVYNGTGKVFQYCDGTDWVRMHNRAGSGSGGCANPAKSEGQMVYNADGRVLQGCAGNVWRPMGATNGQNEWAQVAAGRDHTCGLKTDGSLWCWGSGSSGQLGNGLTTGSLVPEMIGNDNWKQITAGQYHSCGIKSDDTAWCWGMNTDGRIGDNTSGTNRLVPTAVSGGGSWKFIEAGAGHTCGIKSDNTAWCWGGNGSGQIGDNTSGTNRLVPTAVNGGSSWKAISAGGHTCGIQSDDSVWCWGGNSNGQIGDNTSGTNRLVPTAVNGGGNWKAIGVGGSHSCGIKSDDTLHCWGANGSGATGMNTTTGNTLVPTGVSGGGSWKKIAAGTNHNCAVKADNTAWCWGYNIFGQLGDGTSGSGTDKLVPTAVAAGGAWASITAGELHSCGIKAGGVFSCWGMGDDGERGDNVSRTQAVPVAVAGGNLWNPVITTNQTETCSIKTDNTLWCWTANLTQVPNGGSWKTVSKGNGHACGIKSDDTAWCWGSNGNGQLGDNSTTSSAVPVAVSGGGTWKWISAGGMFGTSCGIKSDNTAWCWGDGTYGQRGDGVFSVTQTTPVAVSGGGTWKMISTAMVANHTCAIKSDDTVWCWGRGNRGQLGDGSLSSGQNTPVAVSGGGTWKWISTGGNNGTSCGIKSDDTAWCWGHGSSGQRGDNSTVGSQSTPVTLNGGGTWKRIQPGNAHTCGIKSDNTAWCWGSNSGQIGDGTTTTRLVPTAVSGGYTWKEITAGSAHSCAIRSDDSTWCWGDNYGFGAGTLGNGVQPVSGSAQQSWCGGPARKPGSILYNSDFSVMQYCDGAGWVSIGKGFASGGGSDIVTSGLVGFWKFDESAGTGATDSSGTGNNGTLTSFPASPWLPSGGQVNGALDFDGTNDFVDVPDDATLDFERTDSFSIAVWIYRDASTTEDDIIEKVDGSWTGYALWLPEDGNTIGGDDVVVFTMQDNSANVIAGFTPAASIPVGAWTHIAATYNGSSALGGMSIYINGISQTVNNFRNDILTTSILHNDSLKIGTDTGSGCCEFDGKIDDVRIYNRVLSAGEIAQLAGQ